MRPKGSTNDRQPVAHSSVTSRYTSRQMFRVKSRRVHTRRFAADKWTNERPADPTTCLHDRYHESRRHRFDRGKDSRPPRTVNPSYEFPCSRFDRSKRTEREIDTRRSHATGKTYRYGFVVSENSCKQKELGGNDANAVPFLY